MTGRTKVGGKKKLFRDFRTRFDVDALIIQGNDHDQNLVGRTRLDQEGVKPEKVATKISLTWPERRPPTQKLKESLELGGGRRYTGDNGRVRGNWSDSWAKLSKINRKGK